MASVFTFLINVQSKCDVQSEVGGRGQRAERWLGSALSFDVFRNIIPAVSVELLLLLEVSLKETGLKHAETKNKMLEFIDSFMLRYTVFAAY